MVSRLCFFSLYRSASRLSNEPRALATGAVQASTRPSRSLTRTVHWMTGNWSCGRFDATTGLARYLPSRGGCSFKSAPCASALRWIASPCSGVNFSCRCPALFRSAGRNSARMSPSLECAVECSSRCPISCARTGCRPGRQNQDHDGGQPRQYCDTDPHAHSVASSVHLPHELGDSLRAPYPLC